jgi:nucleotide-binding universal stress UspA family protein
MKRKDFFMTQMKKILVPTDFSKSSGSAVRFAFSLARENYAELIVLHVAWKFQAWEICDDAFLAPTLYASEAGRTVREAGSELNRFLGKHLEEARYVCNVSRRVVFGGVVEKIIETAEKEQVDLIVMAPRRHGIWKRLLLGSVTQEVTRSAPCPVLAISVPKLHRPWRGRYLPSVGGILRGSEA